MRKMEPSRNGSPNCPCAKNFSLLQTISHIWTDVEGGRLEPANDDEGREGDEAEDERHEAVGQQQMSRPRALLLLLVLAAHRQLVHA